jgi:hypothetical protein
MLARSLWLYACRCSMSSFSSANTPISPALTLLNNFIEVQKTRQLISYGHNAVSFYSSGGSV